MTFASRGRQAVHSPVDFRILDICSDCFGLLHAPTDLSWDSRRASTSLRQTSSTVMLPEVAGLVVDPSRCTQHWPVHATPVVITLALTTLRVFDDGARLAIEWSPVRNQ